MGQLAVPLLLAGAGLTFAGQMRAASAAEEQGAQQQQIYNMQAENSRKIAERNAMIRTDEAKYAAARKREQAVQEEAAAIKKSKERRRQTGLRVSSAVAAAAAGGGGATDPTVLDIIGDIVETGEFGAATDIYEGKSRAGLLRTDADLAEYQGERDAESIRYGGATDARLLTYQGSAAKYAGESEAASTRISAAGNLVSGVASAGIAAKYAPKSMSADDIAWNDPGSSSWYGGVTT